MNERFRRLLKHVPIVSEHLERFVIIFNACGLIGAFLYPTWLLHVYVISRRVEEPPLSLAYSFLIVQAAAILAQLVVSCTIKKLDEKRAASSHRIRPVIREELALHVAGKTQLEEMRRLVRWNRRDVEVCLAEILSVVEGRGRQRLTTLVDSLKLTSRWEQQAALGDPRERKRAVEYLGLLSNDSAHTLLRRLLKDPLPFVQTAACRSLVRSAEGAELRHLFRTVIGKPFLVRVIMAGELKARSAALSGEVLSEELASSEFPRLLAALEMVEGWRQSLDLPSLSMLLDHQSPEVRSRALRLVPFSRADLDTRRWVLEALEDQDDRVKAAALFAAARMRLKSTIPFLERYTESASADLARLACTALAQMGQSGWDILQVRVVTASHQQAAFAAEALAVAKLGSLQVARP